METGFILLNASHQERRPAGPRAAVRLLGGFATAEAAKEHASLLPQDCDLLLAPIGKAFALTRALPTDEGAHLQKLLATHLRRLRDHEREFQDNVAEQTAGRANSGKEAAGDHAAAAAPESVGHAPDRIGRNFELRYQNFAVISVLADSDEPCTDSQEPGVVVWGLFDTEEAAKEAIKTRLSFAVKDLHLELVAMYEWLHPTEVSKHLDEIQEEFRDETLTSIMAQHKGERRAVKAFRELCGEQEAPMVDLSQPEPRRIGFSEPTSLTDLSPGSTSAGLMTAVPHAPEVFSCASTKDAS